MNLRGQDEDSNGSYLPTLFLDARGADAVYQDIGISQSKLTNVHAFSGQFCAPAGAVDRFGVEWLGTRPQQTMSLSPGARLGHYDVTALLGEGGMGQVWQATDTQLNRQVALKILPDAFAADPDRLARFTREAQILASLNHPNIAAIYGIEEAEGTRALVLELVEGPTLADRISKGPIPLDEALPIAK